MKKVLTYKILFIWLALTSYAFSQNSLSLTFAVTHVANSNDGRINAHLYSGGSSLSITCKDGSDNIVQLVDSVFDTTTNRLNVMTSSLSEGVYYFHATDGTDHAYKYVWVGKYGASTTLSVQPDENYGVDALIKYTDHPNESQTPDENFGDSENFSASTVTHDGYEVKERSYLKFEYNGLENSTLSSADLTLNGHYYHNHPDDDPSIENDIFVFLVDGGSWSEDEITWNHQVTFVDDENLAGIIDKEGDIDPEPYSDQSFTKTADIKSLIEEHLVGNYTNDGFLMKIKQEYWQRAQKFYSSDHSVSSERPKLTLTFTLPEQKPFVKLNKKLDGGYITLEDDRNLRFIYIEEYEDTDGKLTFNIYDNKHQVVMNNSDQTIDIQHGKNWEVLVMDICLCNENYYILEVINEKKEKWYLRFKTHQASSAQLASCASSSGPPSY